MATNPLFPATIKNIGLELTNSTPINTSQVLYTAGSAGTKIDHICITNSDTVAHDVKFYISNGTTDFLLAVVPVVASAGTTNALNPVYPTVNVMGASSFFPYLLWPADVTGNRAYYLQAGWTMKVQIPVVMSSGKVLHITGFAGDF